MKTLKNFNFSRKVKTLCEGHKIWKNLPLVLTKQLFFLSSVKTSGRFFQILLTSSEKLNLKSTKSRSQNLPKLVVCFIKQLWLQQSRVFFRKKKAARRSSVSRLLYGACNSRKNVMKRKSLLFKTIDISSINLKLLSFFKLSCKF